VVDLVRQFRPQVKERLAARRARQAEINAGASLDFLPETRDIRAGDWRCAPLPPALLDRRVEITGPVDRKMIINALNSGASAFMADFEDANSPTRANCFDGQVNLSEAVRRTLRYVSPEGKEYKLGEKLAVLLVRPRGWHLPEAHVVIDGEAAPGGLVDFGLYFFHNAQELLNRGAGPYFYLPKMESHREARLWNEVFVYAQDALGIPRGSIKATCLIETLPGAFEMDEFLYELREHSAGLNCGRWDYIFSYIKVNRENASRVLPDRSQVGMTQHFLRSYSRLLIKTCHKRGVHAMGGMSALIPVKGDEAKNQQATDGVRADKLREVTDGHDGTWVAHPALVSVAREIFDAHMPGANQIESGKQSDFTATVADLLQPSQGTRTEHGVRHNLRVGVQYVEAWLRGAGAVPLYNLMEDAATAEISRAQLWQWTRHRVALDDSQAVVTRELLSQLLEEELAQVRREVGEERFGKGRFAEAARLFLHAATAEPMPDFLTLPAYEALIAQGD
jgi:malate synthase